MSEQAYVTWLLGGGAAEEGKAREKRAEAEAGGGGGGVGDTVTNDGSTAALYTDRCGQ